MSSQTDAIAIPDIAANLAAVRARIRAAAVGAARGAAVSLVAVSKTHGEDRIRPALEAGHRVFGENRVQEAETKWPALKADFADVRLHLIGPLQTNKARVAVGLADVIETIDRPKLARAVAAEMDRAGRRPDCFIEVNTGEEPQKHGVAPDQADDFVRACRDEYQLPIIGLMCVPPLNEEPSLHFALLRKIAERNGLAHLSMGMSRDFEIAIAFGASQVRVGTAIFGGREAR